MSNITNSIQKNEQAIALERLLATIEQQHKELFRLKSIITSLPGSLYWKDQNGIYLGRNSSALEKMIQDGLEIETDLEEVVGKTDFDIFPYEVAKKYRKHDIEVMTTGQESTIEEESILPDGRTIVQLSTKRPMRDETGQIVGIIGNTVDITYLKTIERELREAKEKAESLSRLKTDFIRNMEHDIRTPFSGIWGLANHLAESETDIEKKELLTDISSCAKELLDYCNSILDFSKVESESLPVLHKKFSLPSLLEKVIAIEKPTAKHKNLQLEFSWDNRLPNVIIGDEYRLFRILVNLASNSIKFTAQGYVNINVSLVGYRQNQVIIKFMIEDSGIGIPHDKLTLIYEKFTRLTPANRGTYKGLGLGLTIVKQFIHEIEGEIEVVTQENIGTTFVCVLPFTQALSQELLAEGHYGKLAENIIS